MEVIMKNKIRKNEGWRVNPSFQLNPYQGSDTNKYFLLKNLHTNQKSDNKHGYITNPIKAVRPDILRPQ
jgi:hypothetical protein